MLSLRRTPFSSMMWETPLISVVERMGSSGCRRPLESMRCDAKMVLMRVDLPSPVWPVEGDARQHVGSRRGGRRWERESSHRKVGDGAGATKMPRGSSGSQETGEWDGEMGRTNADDVELEAALQQLLLDLRSDAVETDMGLGEDGVGGLCLGHCGSFAVLSTRMFA
jgi:hypothetical protein